MVCRNVHEDHPHIKQMSAFGGRESAQTPEVTVLETRVPAAATASRPW
jgi:hypothetical protein